MSNVVIDFDKCKITKTFLTFYPKHVIAATKNTLLSAYGLGLSMTRKKLSEGLNRLITEESTHERERERD